jgi:hypothetical protein
MIACFFSFFAESGNLSRRFKNFDFLQHITFTPSWPALLNITIYCFYTKSTVDLIFKRRRVSPKNEPAVS